VFQSSCLAQLLFIRSNLKLTDILKVFCHSYTSLKP